MKPPVDIPKVVAAAAAGQPRNGLPSIRYFALERRAQPSAWAEDWRLRWLRHAGSVHYDQSSNGLVAYYSNSRDPTARLALQAELDGRLNGPAEVAAVCRKVTADFNAMIRAVKRRSRASKQLQIGGVQ